MSRIHPPEFGDLSPDISEILLTENQIQQRVGELAGEISELYRDKNPVLVGVLKGVLFFMADLLRALPIATEVDFLSVANYGGDSRKQGPVRLVKDLETPIEGRHVLFVEDVIDTGLTLNYLLRTLKARQPASLEVCVLFNKPTKRLIDIPLRFKGFDIPDRFVVGYGLDFHEKYRNLPFVGLLKPGVFSPKL
ncbi:hypoxanthine phosphoribosyltransferase [Longilinea arvoryzae]|uniref:Hypoxanthine phosphoribosyltransferase n=1 Tax=Longilinea arvoryzae TaxID=360412 RepID=A0A0S7BBM5_9CHLR|nr:hypoxanthine phosphoribosyltransferase [Longilinea arvoryzae]GAP15054.1 hypoxanthine phosphoribosyltransferase [Longilinea arvoryzae]